MKQVSGKGISKERGWLLFFYSVPSKPVSNRMKVWRRLAKAGAVQVKGAVYVLPLSEEHHEFFQWLVSEVTTMGGEAAFTKVEGIDSMKDQEIIDLFIARKTEEYQLIGRTLEDIETRVNSIRKGSKPKDIKASLEQFRKLSRSFEEVKKTDFFNSGTGNSLRVRIDGLNSVIENLAGTAPSKKSQAIVLKRVGDYQDKVWVSRTRPFVDRIASAWLIRRLIDKNPSFRFADEKQIISSVKDQVTFDVSEGEFTHVGDLCTFEVLMRSFGIKDKAVRKIAEIVHELDIKDDRYRTSEAGGLEEILSGIRKSEKDDNVLLEKGMTIFELLYVSKTG